MFEIGTKIVSAIKLSSKSSVSGFARLPSEYQEVEYIETTGTQYINNITLPVDFKFTINAYFEDTSTYYNVYDNNNVSPLCMLWVYSSGKLELNADHNNLANFTSNVPTTVVSDNTGSSNVLYVDGTQVLQLNKVSSISGDITLLHRGASDGFKGKIENIKVENSDGDLLYNFIPCYRISDGVIGFYDLANNQFCTNVGSGAFTKGRDILYGINSHTLRYYPFASNVADRMRNGTRGTVSGTVSYSDNGIVISGDSGYVTGMTNGIANRDTYTQIFRARYTSFPDNYGLLIGDSSNYNTNSSFAFETGGDGSGYFRVYNFIGSGDVIGPNSQMTPRDTYFHLWVITADHGSYKLYKDGELYLEGTTTGTINNQPNMNLGRSSYYGSQREGYGEVKDYIVEDIPRSAQKIKDFYNLYGVL